MTVNSAHSQDVSLIATPNMIGDRGFNIHRHVREDAGAYPHRLKLNR